MFLDLMELVLDGVCILYLNVLYILVHRMGSF